MIAVAPADYPAGEISSYLIVVKRCVFMGEKPEHEFIRWWWNAIDGIFWGHYFGTMLAAMQDFVETLSGQFN